MYIFIYKYTHTPVLAQDRIGGLGFLLVLLDVFIQGLWPQRSFQREIMGLGISKLDGSSLGIRTNLSLWPPFWRPGRAPRTLQVFCPSLFREGRSSPNLKPADAHTRGDLVIRTGFRFKIYYTCTGTSSGCENQNPNPNLKLFSSCAIPGRLTRQPTIKQHPSKAAQVFAAQTALDGRFQVMRRACQTSGRCSSFRQHRAVPVRAEGSGNQFICKPVR